MVFDPMRALQAPNCVRLQLIRCGRHSGSWNLGVAVEKVSICGSRQLKIWNRNYRFQYTFSRFLSGFLLHARAALRYGT
jgi:hypothetical protein